MTCLRVPGTRSRSSGSLAIPFIDSAASQGFGLGAKPVGAYVIHEGEVTWKPAVDVNRLVAMAFVLGLVFALRARR